MQERESAPYAHIVVHRLAPDFAVLPLTCPPFDMHSPEPTASSCRRHLNLDDSPIKPAIDGHKIKSFEEFLNISLQNNQLEEEAVNEHAGIPKRPFLRKGTGLVRYKPPAGSPRKARLCQSVSCDQQNQRQMKRSISSGSSAGGGSVHILPRTTSRFSTTSRGTVSVSRKDVPFNPIPKQTLSKQRTERCVQTSSSLENLEGLLRTVRDRKEEVIRQLVQSDESSSSEWEEDGEEDEQSGDEEVLLDFKESKLVKPRKKVRWMKKTKAAKLLSGRPKLSKPSPGPYSLHLAHSIHELENKLHHLQARCKSSSSPKKVIDETDVIDETMALKKEVVSLNDKLKALTNELKTLQVMTGKAANISNKQALEKRTKVTVHKNASLSTQTTIRRDISLPRHNDESIVYFENGCTMQRFKDNTVIHTFKNGTKQTTFPDGTKLVEFSK